MMLWHFFKKRRHLCVILWTLHERIITAVGRPYPFYLLRDRRGQEKKGTLLWVRWELGKKLKKKVVVEITGPTIKKKRSLENIMKEMCKNEVLNLLKHYVGKWSISTVLCSPLYHQTDLDHWIENRNRKL